MSCRLNICASSRQAIQAYDGARELQSGGDGHICEDCKGEPLDLGHILRFHRTPGWNTAWAHVPGADRYRVVNEGSLRDEMEGTQF